MKDPVIQKALKTASAQLRKFESEADILKAKIAELNERIASSEKEARAKKIALQLTLDEDVIKDINEKAASLKNEDLTVVEKAMELDLTKKVASLGDLDDNEADKDPLKRIQDILLGKKK